MTEIRDTRMTRMTRDELRLDTVRVLTQAARQTSPTGQRLDFAGFLTRVLVATAANVGGPDELLAGRPRSWEAAHLADLLYGAAHWEGSPWEYRTEPLLIPLNVAEIIDDRELHPGLVTLDEAIEVIDRRYIGIEETEAALDAWTVEVETLSDRYEAEYKRYAERFAVAAHLYGRALTPPLEVRVIADTSPSPRWWDDTRVTNPIAADGDPLAVAIWRLAHDTVALPNIDAHGAAEFDRADAAKDR